MSLDTVFIMWILLVDFQLENVKCITKVLAVKVFYFILIDMIKSKRIVLFLKILACFITHRNFGNLQIQSKYGKIRTRKNPVFEYFSRSVIYTHLFILIYSDLSILMFSLYYYTNLLKLIKYGKYRNYHKIFQIEDCFLVLTMITQKQLPKVFYKKGCPYKFCNIYRKKTVLESFFNKVARLQVYLKETPTLKNTYFEKDQRTATSDYSFTSAVYSFSAVSLQL